MKCWTPSEVLNSPELHTPGSGRNSIQTHCSSSLLSAPPVCLGQWGCLFRAGADPGGIFLQLDPEQEAARRGRGAQEKMAYSLVSVPEGNDISSIFELDPTTLRGGDSLVPRYALTQLRGFGGWLE